MQFDFHLIRQASVTSFKFNFSSLLSFFSSPLFWLWPIASTLADLITETMPAFHTLMDTTPTLVDTWDMAMDATTNSANLYFFILNQKID